MNEGWNWFAQTWQMWNVTDLCTYLQYKFNCFNTDVNDCTVDWEYLKHIMEHKKFCVYELYNISSKNDFVTIFASAMKSNDNIERFWQLIKALPAMVEKDELNTKKNGVDITNTKTHANDKSVELNVVDALQLATS